MTYVKRRFKRKPPKDILNQALKHLWPGEELICTKNTYESIRDRVDLFSQSRQDRKYDTIPFGVIRKIRRVA